MATSSLQQRLNQLLEGTDVQINGTRPWDIQVHDDRFYARVLAQGSLGFGEAYMDGWWECEQIDELIKRLLRQDIRTKLKPNPGLVWDAVQARVMNRQSTL